VPPLRGMTREDLTLDVLLIALAILAWLRARRHPEHGAIAWLFTLEIPSVWVRRALRLGLFEPRRAALRAHGIDPASVPLTSLLRVARHLHDAMGQIWGWGLVLVTILALRRGRWWLALAGYSASMLVLILGYPELRYRPLAVALLVIQTVEVVAILAVVFAWIWRRTPTIPPGRTEGLVVVLGAFHASLVVPMWMMAEQRSIPVGSPTPNPFTSWYLAQGQFVALYAVAVLAHLVPNRWTPRWPWRSGTRGGSSSSQSSPSASSSLHS